MNLIQGRERALANLLQSIPDISADSRPDHITLPDLVHQETLAAVSQTHDDGRERKTGFRFIHGRWFAGLMRTGSAVTLQKDGATTNASTGTNSYIGRPHLHMHTHPSPDPEGVVESVHRRPHTKDWSKSKQADLINRESNFHAGSHMLPSRGDLNAIYSTSFGTVGNIIASSGGIFLSLRNDVRDKEWLIHQDPEHVKQLLDDYREAFQFFIRERYSPFVIRNVLLKAAAHVLVDRYSCNFVDDPENSTLQKVEER
jgi:hypothetical protein